MFQGSSLLTLDAKGRMAIPTRHRDALYEQEQGCMTITRQPDGCLLIYPRSKWLEKRTQIMALPMSARSLQRMLLGSAMDVEMDSAGRVLISPELRSAAGLEKEAMLLGLGEHFELWNPSLLKASEEGAQSAMSTVLESFSF